MRLKVQDKGGWQERGGGREQEEKENESSNVGEGNEKLRKREDY